MTSQLVRVSLTMLFVSQLKPVGDGQIQTVRSGVNVVRVDVSVLDRHRLPVSDLGPGDFTITDDGERRRVTAFLRVSLQPPVGFGTSEERTADEAGAAAVERQPENTGRLVAILFDRTIQVGESTVAARQIATAIVDSLALHDYAAILRSSGFAGEGRAEEFTQNRERLRAAIAAPFVGMTSPPTMGPGGLSEGPRLQQTGECICGSCALDAITAVAHSIRADDTHRKLLLFIGSDMPFISESAGCGSRLRQARERLFREVDASNLTMHVLDPTGLEGGGIEAGSLNRHSDQVATAVTQRIRDRLVRQGNLAVLPERTGGRLVTSTNGPASFAADILAESSCYYLLGFEPSGAKPGKEHRIEVTVDRPEVRIMARKAYTMPKH